MDLVCPPCNRTFGSYHAVRQHLRHHPFHNGGLWRDRDLELSRILRVRIDATRFVMPDLLLKKLEGMVHAESLLLSSGFILEIPNRLSGAASIPDEGKDRKCARCNESYIGNSGYCRYHWGERQEPGGGMGPGFRWSCCFRTYDQPGCKQRHQHVFRIENDTELHASSPFVSWQDVIDGRSPEGTYKKAVALKCEMAYTESGLEVVSLSVVSLPKGTVLHDSLVQPEYPVIDDNFQISGVSMDYLNQAKGAMTSLLGINEARARVLDFVNKDTIIVGHGLSHDLKNLRLIHNKIIDTSLIYKEADSRETPDLKSLFWEKLGPEIKTRPERGGHRGVNGACAAMNLCLLKADWPRNFLAPIQPQPIKPDTVNVSPHPSRQANKWQSSMQSKQRMAMAIPNAGLTVPNCDIRQQSFPGVTLPDSPGSPFLGPIQPPSKCSIRHVPFVGAGQARPSRGDHTHGNNQSRSRLITMSPPLITSGAGDSDSEKSFKEGNYSPNIQHTARNRNNLRIEAMLLEQDPCIQNPYETRIRTAPRLIPETHVNASQPGQQGLQGRQMSGVHRLYGFSNLRHML